MNNEIEQLRDAYENNVDFIDATTSKKRKKAAWKVPKSIQLKRLLMEPVKSNVGNVIEKQNEELVDIASVGVDSLK